MSYAAYYRDQFRSDFSDLVAAHKLYHTDDGIVVQPRMLSVGSKPLHDWPPSRQRLFLTALYFTVLVDQVCYTHFHASYSRFRELTQYPKLRGDCPGGCFGHRHPSDVFAFAARRDSEPYWDGRVECREEFLEAVPTMRSEVKEFCVSFMPELDADKFWQLCESHLPRWGA